jgi:hypothetical protein
MVRRWLLIGYFPILYYPQLEVPPRGQLTSCGSQLTASFLLHPLQLEVPPRGQLTSCGSQLTASFLLHSLQLEVPPRGQLTSCGSQLTASFLLQVGDEPLAAGARREFEKLQAVGDNSAGLTETWTDINTTCGPIECV